MVSITSLPEETDDEVIQKFKCCKCSIQVDSLKLLKSHIWTSHLSKHENLNNETSPVVEKPKKRRKLDYKQSKSSKEIESDDAQEEASEETETEKGIQRVQQLSEDEYKLFNFENIDENNVFERSMSMYPSKTFDKATEIKKCKVGWAHWKSKGVSIMWPCMIEKYAKDSHGMKVFFRYYEVNSQKGNVFKMPLNKIELFFRSSDHFDIKKTSAALTRFKYDFFLCYTNALKDYVDFLDKNESLNEASESESACLSNLFKSVNKSEAKNKYLVLGKMYSLEEVKEMAEREPSEDQLRENKERIESSGKLLEVVLTPECEEHLISIFTDKIDCVRHKDYINGDLATRRKMKFSSPGPLVEDDQQKLANFINKISKEKYLNKPDNLVSYEYDVLYPEAVVWGLKKLHNLTNSRAETKYKQGFKRTDEERIKKRCNEILNNIDDKSVKNSSLNDSGSKNDSSLLDNLEETCLDQEENCLEKDL